jgi:ParB family chromosome partitioning protein
MFPSSNGLVKIADIIIGNRFRKDMGDLESMAESIRNVGLLHPIVIKPDKTLVAGHRRIEAAKLLGCSEISATVVDLDDLLSAERDENEQRKAFTRTESVALGRLIEKIHKAKIAASRIAMARKGTAVREARRKGVDTSHVKNVAGPEPLGATDQVVGEAVGMSEKTYYQAKKIVQAAADDPERYGDLPGQMDETGNVNGTYTELERRKSNGASGRHPIHRKTRRPDVGRIVESVVRGLEGLCETLEGVDISGIGRPQATAWGKEIDGSLSTIRKFRKRLG